MQLSFFMVHYMEPRKRRRWQDQKARNHCQVGAAQIPASMHGSTPMVCSALDSLIMQSQSQIDRSRERFDLLCW